MTAVQKTSAVRDLTDGEVGHFHEHGWVMLRNLISPELAGAIAAGAKQRLGEAGERSDAEVTKLDFFDTSLRPSLDGDPYRLVAYSPALGRSAARLLGRDSAIRLFYDQIAVKRPATKGGVATAYHQDHAVFPLDRSCLTFWIALEDVTPEMGSMRFFDRSQQLGAVGRGLFTAEEMTERWPRLKDHPRSEPLTYRPGDATAHHSFVIHGGAENSTDRTRWSYHLIITPADSRATFKERITENLDLELFQVIDHPDFPVIYSPS